MKVDIMRYRINLYIDSANDDQPIHVEISDMDTDWNMDEELLRAMDRYSDNYELDNDMDIHQYTMIVEIDGGRLMVSGNNDKPSTIS